MGNNDSEVLPWDAKVLMSKKGLGEFCVACLSMRVRVSGMCIVGEPYPRTPVYIRVHATLEQREALTKATGVLLESPPVPNLD
jgi:hypothetical protein